MKRTRADGKRVKQKSVKKKLRKFTLHLYVAGLSPRSQKAITNIKKFCDENLKGQYKLAIHDINQNPMLAKKGQILAVPTLVKEMPLPLRKFVGDLSDKERLLFGLDLKST